MRMLLTSELSRRCLWTLCFSKYCKYKQTSTRKCQQNCITEKL